MTKKEEVAKFEKVPQVEIDQKLYHESAEVVFGIVKEVLTSEKGGNVSTTRLYKLKKYILVRSKVVNESVVRTEEGNAGRITVRNQLEIEMKKELKRLDKGE